MTRTVRKPNVPLPPDLTPAVLATLQNDVRARRELLSQVVRSYESRYDCSLEELERRLQELAVEEHPTWEDSIEWRNAVEQLEQTRLSESIFVWLQGLLKQSASS